MARLRLFPIFLVAIAAWYGKGIYDRAATIGVFRKPYNLHGTGEIRRIADTINAEDLHYDARSGLIYAAAQDRDGTRATWFPPLANFGNPKDAYGGGLRVIDPKTFTAKRLKLEGFSGPFNTHGIDIFHDPSRPDALYIHAVNHAPNAAWAASEPRDADAKEKAHSRVEIFHHLVGSDSAQHIRTVLHELIFTPNDIFSVGPTSFYVTNDHKHREGKLRFVETLLTRSLAPWSSTIYVDADAHEDGADGVRAKVAIASLHNNNGLGHGPDGSVILCDAAGGVAYFAKINDDHTLHVFDEEKIPGTIDNPFWFEDPYPTVGRDRSGLLLAGLTRGVDLDGAIEHGSAIPTLVWLTSGRPVESGKHEMDSQVIFADDGKVLNSASAGVLLAIDPKTNGGKKQAWLFASGFASEAVIAVKVDL